MNSHKVNHPATPAVAPLHHAQGHLPGHGQPPHGPGRAPEGPGRFGDALFLLGRAGQRLAQGAARGLRQLARGGAKARGGQDGNGSVDNDDHRRSLAASFSMQADAGDGEGGNHEAGAEEARSLQRRHRSTAGPAGKAGAALTGPAAGWARAVLAQGGHPALRDAMALQCMRFGASAQTPVRTQVLPVTAAALHAAGGRLDFGGWSGVRDHLLKADATLQPPRTGLSAQLQQMNLLRPLLLHQLGLRRTPSQMAALLARSTVLCLAGPPSRGDGGVRAGGPAQSAPPDGPVGAAPTGGRAPDTAREDATHGL
jgi:hypothetical protein